MLPPGESLWVCALLVSPLLGQLWANMTSSTKPEVHNVLHYRQRRSQPRPQITRAENFVKFRRVVCEICERRDVQKNTNRQTYGHAYRNILHSYSEGEVIKLWYKSVIKLLLIFVLINTFTLWSLLSVAAGPTVSIVDRSGWFLPRDAMLARY